MNDILKTKTPGEAPGAVVSASGGKSTPGTVSGILQNSSPTPTVEFMTETPDGVLINVQKPEDLKSLNLYISTPMSHGQYFVNFDYTKVSELLFNTDPNSLIFPLPPIKIGSKLLPIPAERVSLYTKPMVSGDEKTVEYYFEPRYIGDSKEPTELNIDEFIATLWKKGIYHGIDITRITKAISESEQGKIVIAKETPPTKTIHPKFEAIKSLKIESKPKGADSSARIDIRVHEQALLQCKEIGEALLRKIHGSLGEEGWTIFGKRIDPEPIQDFDVQKYLGNGVKVQVIDGYDCICSTMVGFIYFKKGKLEKGEYIDGFDRVRIAEKMEIKDIGMSTGKIDVHKSILTPTDIKEDIDDAEDIEAKANVEANITARGNIKIDGNVYGNIGGNQRSGSIVRGKVTSSEGDIQIKKRVTYAFITAKNGTINIGESQNSTIIGDTIEIGSAHNSLIVGDTVIISGTATGCRIIAKSIIIKESAPGRGDENICTIFSHDLSQEIAQIEEIMQELNTIIEKMKIGLDHHIGSIAKAFREQKDPEKKIFIRGIMMDFIFNTKKRKDIDYGQFQKLYDVLESRIAFKEIKIKSEADKKNPKWEAYTFINIHNRLSEISGILDQKKAYIEQEREYNKIVINNANTTTYFRQLSYTETRDLLDLTIEEMVAISKHRLEGKIIQYFKISYFTTHSSGKFSWKAT